MYMKKRVADIIIEELIKRGITDCFAVVGGGAMHIDNALACNQNMTKYFHHHEQACAMAAESYARVSGRMALVSVTSGPGATNTLTGVLGAWQDSLPIIIISGQVRYEISVEKAQLPLRYRGTQEYNIVPAVQHMTKYAVMLKDPYAVKQEIAKAVTIAMDGRRGPVWLDIPLDVQSAVIEEDDLYAEIEGVVPKREIDKEKIKKVESYLRDAKRPCILLGSGIISGNVKKEFLAFAEKVQVPIVGGAWVAENLHAEHPRFYGLSGNVGPRTGNFILQNADVILVLGNSLSFRQTGFQQEAFAPNAQIIMVDADEYEGQKPGLHLKLFLHNDLKQFFDNAIVFIDTITAADEWWNYCNCLKQRFTPYEAIEHLDMEERVCGYFFWKAFEELATDDTIVALGNNTANSAKLQIGIQKEHQRVITNYTCGSMGYDLPAAIGAAVASKREVLCITGDGSIMMNLQELQTIKQYKLPVKVIIFANDGYNAMRQTCKNFFQGVFIGCNADTGVSFPEFSKIADAFGYDYKKCTCNNEVKNCLQWVLDAEEPVILEIEQRLDDPITPKVMSRIKDDGTFETPVLQDMAPFLDRDEYDKWMLW